jgi:hypothetical protein
MDRLELQPAFPLKAYGTPADMVLSAVRVPRPLRGLLLYLLALSAT